MGCSSSRPSSSSAVMSPNPTALPRADSDLGDHDMYEVYSQNKSTSAQQNKRRESNHGSRGSEVSQAVSSSSSATSVPFWVIKTRNSEQHKVFVNVCGTSLVGKTSNFSKPVMRVLPPLEDMDKKNDDAFTYDALLSLEDCEFLSKTHGEFGDLDGFWTEINKAIISRINEICGDELISENLSYPLLINKYKGSHVRSPNEAKSSNSKQRRNSLSKTKQLEMAESIDDVNLTLPPQPPSSSSQLSSSSQFSSKATEIDRPVHTKKLPTASLTPRRATATTLSLLTPHRKTNANMTSIPPPPSSTDSRGIERSSYAKYTKTMQELKSKLEEQGRRRSNSHSSASSSSGKSFNSSLGNNDEADDGADEDIDKNGKRDHGDDESDGAIMKNDNTKVLSVDKTKHFDHGDRNLRMIPRGVSVAL